MKNIVIYDDMHVPDFKPSSLIKEYLELVEKDIGMYFLGKEHLNAAACPGCRKSETASSFMKFGMQYHECAFCQTLWISPRPSDAMLNRFYRESKSRKFWRDKLSQSTKDKRSQKIIKPRYEWICDSTSEYYPSADHILDVNTNQTGVINEIAGLRNFHRKTLLNPLVDTPDKFSPKFQTVSQPIENVAFENAIDVVTLFEVIDRTADIEKLFDKLNLMLKAEGLCFLTTILSSGFDLMILHDQAENLFPPDRLNVFSVEGLKLLFERHGFRILEFSTPGVLDLEIIARSLEANPALSVPRFVKYLIEKRNEDVRKSFQEFLESALLSSYGRILIQRI